MLGGHRLAVGPRGDHRVVGVAGEDDARGDRDRGAGEAVGVAAAVPALVLVAHDRREVPELRGAPQDPLADHGVLGHHAPLGVGQRPGLVEDLVRDRELADVVQQRAVAHLLEVGGREAEQARDVRGQRDDLLGVLVGVVVAGLDRGRQRLHRGGRARLLAGAEHRHRLAREPLDLAQPLGLQLALEAQDDQALGAGRRAAAARRRRTRRARRGRRPCSRRRAWPAGRRARAARTRRAPAARRARGRRRGARR